MTNKQARIRTYEGIWNRISQYVKDKIENACDEGDFEITVKSYNMKDSDKELLVKLGYCLTYDYSDEFDPVYYISWKYEN